MTGYHQKLTSEVTFDAAIDDLAEIEAIMRDGTGGTLDYLGPVLLVGIVGLDIVQNLDGSE